MAENISDVIRDIGVNAFSLIILQKGVELVQFRSFVRQGRKVKKERNTTHHGMSVLATGKRHLL